MNDPWDWTKQSMQAPPSPQANNTLAVPASGQTQAPPPMQGPPGVGQMAKGIVVARGVNEGINKTYEGGKDFFAKQDPSKVPVEDAKVAIDNTIKPMSRSMGEAQAPLSEASTTNVVTPIETMGASAAGTAGANAVLPASMMEGASAAGVMELGSAPLAAASSTAATTTAATTGAGLAEAGTLAGMGPVGWGIGALLLAKQMKWI